MSERYCIYLRKSRADLEAESHGQGETLTRHREILLAIAESMGITIETIYSEIVSGETIAARPVMQKLLSEIEAGLWTGVFVTEVERLARGNTIDQGVVAQAFSLSGAKIITPLKTYDPNNEFDEEYFEFGLFMSRREYKVINRRIQRGRIASFKEGNYISSVAPYGYIRTKNTSSTGYTLTINEAEAPAIRMIFDLYANGEHGVDVGSYRIAERLNALGYVTRAGRPWAACTVRDIIRNQTYAGKVRWGRRPEQKIVENGKLVRRRPRVTKQPMTVLEGKHEAIVSDELFIKANEKLTGRKTAPAPSNTAISNPLAGVVVCALCGRRLTKIKDRSGVFFLKCPNPTCGNISSKLTIIEKRVLDVLGHWANDYKSGKAGTLAAESAMLRDNYISSLKTVENELAKTEEQLDKVADLLESGVYTVQRYRERTEKLEARRSELTKEKNDLEQKLEVTKKNNDIQMGILPKIELLTNHRDEMSAAEANILYKQVIEKAVYKKDEHGKKGRADATPYSLILFPVLPKNNI